MATIVVGHIVMIAAINWVQQVYIKVNGCMKQLIAIVTVVVLIELKQADHKLFPHSQVLTECTEFEAIEITAELPANAKDVLILWSCYVEKQAVEDVTKPIIAVDQIIHILKGVIVTTAMARSIEQLLEVVF